MYRANAAVLHRIGLYREKATGFSPREDEAEALRACADEFWKIGDCYQVRRVFNAMREGYNAGNYIR